MHRPGPPSVLREEGRELWGARAAASEQQASTSASPALTFIYDKYSPISSGQKFFETIPSALASRRIESSDSPILRMAPQIA